MLPPPAKSKKHIKLTKTEPRKKQKQEKTKTDYAKTFDATALVKYYCVIFV